jgi:hypothetical protein
MPQDFRFLARALKQEHSYQSQFSLFASTGPHGSNLCFDLGLTCEPSGPGLVAHGMKRL